MSPISVQHKSSINDLIKGYQLYLKARPLLFYPFLFCLCVLINRGIQLMSRSVHDFNDNLYLIAILVPITAPFWRWSYAQMMRFSLKKHQDCGKKIKWEFSENEIHRAHLENTDSMSWLQPRRIITHPTGLILDMGCSRFHYLPERAFASFKDFRKICAYSRTHSAAFKELW